MALCHISVYNCFRFLSYGICPCDVNKCSYIIIKNDVAWLGSIAEDNYDFYGPRPQPKTRARQNSVNKSEVFENLKEESNPVTFKWLGFKKTATFLHETCNLTFLNVVFIPRIFTVKI